MFATMHYTNPQFTSVTSGVNERLSDRASLAESKALVESLQQSATPRVTVSQFSTSFTESMFLESSDPDEHVQQLLHEAKLDVERMKSR